MVLYLNTSHVKVNQLELLTADDNTRNLNTSHVKVNQQCSRKIYKLGTYLNTYHVKVNHKIPTVKEITNI